MREKPVIVAAVDPTHSHDKPAALDHFIVDHAQSLARATGGEVHLLHTYHRLVGIGREATRTFKPIELPLDELSRKIQAEHRAKLDELAKANDIDEEHTHQLPGDTKELLPTFARTHGADLVVMGALARWGLKRAVLGSTAEKVLDHLPCDILVVRKAGEDYESSASQSQPSQCGDLPLSASTSKIRSRQVSFGCHIVFMSAFACATGTSW